MDRDPVKRLLDDWMSVAGAVRTPVHAPRRGSAGAIRSGVGLFGAAAAAVAVVIAVVWLGGRISPAQVGSSASPDASAVAVASPTASPSPLPTVGPSVAPAVAASPTPAPPTATPVPSLAACDTADLAAQITSWEGAAGSRIATVTLSVGASGPCGLPTTARPALVDAHHAVLAQGKITNGNGGTADVGTLRVEPGDVLTTLVSVANVCGAAPAPPVTIAFDLGSGVLTAQPLSATDDTVPPCNGPSQPASIEMHPWSR